MSFFSKVNNYFKKSVSDVDTEFTWKYMNIDDILVDEIKDLYSKKINKDLTQYGTYQILDVDVPNILGHKVSVTGLHYTPAGYAPKLSHIDPITHSALALNIPFLNCENTKTVFYESKKLDKFMYKGRIAEGRHLSKCQEIDSYVLDKPILLNTQVLHAVFNYGDKPRVSITLRFEKNPIDWIN
jgi:hypothetical protein